MKIDFKEIGKGLWDVLVIFAYAMFYSMCLMGVMLSLLSSMWILTSAGKDITQIAAGFKRVGYFGLIYIAIIMADKIHKQFWGKEK